MLCRVLSYCLPGFPSPTNIQLTPPELFLLKNKALASSLQNKRGLQTQSPQYSTVFAVWKVLS